MYVRGRDVYAPYASVDEGSRYDRHIHQPMDLVSGSRQLPHLSLANTVTTNAAVDILAQHHKLNGLPHANGGHMTKTDIDEIIAVPDSPTSNSFYGSVNQNGGGSLYGSLFGGTLGSGVYATYGPLKPAHEDGPSNGRSSPGSLGRISPSSTATHGTEMLVEPVDEEIYNGERVVWEFHSVSITREPGYGFGIAVSGGMDNPHFTNGDPSIAISDVITGGPGDGKLLTNDRVLSANGISLENVEYSRAVAVLRESPPTLHLVIKRRVVLPSSQECLKITLSRSRRKEDFGIILGCHVFVKAITSKSLAEKDGGLREGDIIGKINHHSTEGISLKEARKFLSQSKDKVQLLVYRNVEQKSGSDDRGEDDGDGLKSCAQATSNLGNPPMEALYQSGGASHLPNGDGGEGRKHNGGLSLPTVPNDNDIKQHYPSLMNPRHRLTPPDGPGDVPPHLSDGSDAYPPLLPNGDGPPGSLGLTPVPTPDPRFISFRKERSVGIRLTGGNAVGIFVAAVQPNSPASCQGLQPGDKILKVNDLDMKGITREEAVLFLQSLTNQIDLIVQFRKEEFQSILTQQKGDSFHVRAHFDYENPAQGEMGFKRGDIFHVLDTLHNGVVGSWQVTKIVPTPLPGEADSGTIPNARRAEELGAQWRETAASKGSSSIQENSSGSRGGFFSRKRRAARRSKSMGKDHWEETVFLESKSSVSRFPGYERVTLIRGDPGFPRPVVLFGPLVEIARERLCKENPDQFSCPQLDASSGLASDGTRAVGIIRISGIKEVIARGKHALLDVTPSAVDKLVAANLYPIVIFLKAGNKQVIKDLRNKSGTKGPHRSSRKLLEHGQKMEKHWSHLFSASLNLDVDWLDVIQQTVRRCQKESVWAGEGGLVSEEDEVLFPLSARLSSMSATAESEGEETLPPASAAHLSVLSSPSNNTSVLATADVDVVSPEAKGRMTRGSSDPSLCSASLLGGLGIPTFNGPIEPTRHQHPNATSTLLHSNVHRGSTDEIRHFHQASSSSVATILEYPSTSAAPPSSSSAHLRPTTLATADSQGLVYPHNKFPQHTPSPPARDEERQRERGLYGSQDQLKNYMAYSPRESPEDADEMPPPPPRVDRTTKPSSSAASTCSSSSKYSAHERLFGSRSSSSRESTPPITTMAASMPRKPDRLLAKTSPQTKSPGDPTWQPQQPLLSHSPVVSRRAGAESTSGHFGGLPSEQPPLPPLPNGFDPSSEPQYPPFPLSGRRGISSSTDELPPPPLNTSTLERRDVPSNTRFPLPPGKTSAAYKPVPPPKPRSFRSKTGPPPSLIPPKSNGSSAPPPPRPSHKKPSANPERGPEEGSSSSQRTGPRLGTMSFYASKYAPSILATTSVSSATYTSSTFTNGGGHLEDESFYLNIPHSSNNGTSGRHHVNGGIPSAR